MHAKFIRAEASISAAGTLLQVHAANTKRPIKVVDFGVYLTGVDNLGEPIRFQLLVQTSAGTGGGTNTPTKLSREDSNTIEATGLDDSTAWTAQPTASDILHEWQTHPQGGYEKPLALPYVIGSDERVAIRLPDAPGATVNGTCFIEIEE